jgi:hypothetical protein
VTVSSHLASAKGDLDGANAERHLEWIKLNINVRFECQKVFPFIPFVLGGVASSYINV